MRPQSPTINRRIVLDSRPVGMPSASNFRMETLPLPVPGEGEVLLRTLYLSLDPYMRGRMGDGPSYAEPVGVGEAMVGSTISIVHASRHAGFKVGEHVVAQGGWQDYAVSNGNGLTTLTYRDTGLSRHLGVLGMPGFTAYMGLLDIGEPVAGETLVVAAASGAVGSVVGQIGKLKGCRVVGVAGGAEKCRYVVDELGFDACIDHRGSEFAERLSAACPKGVDIYFESVGGAVFDAVLPLLNTRARMPLCGLISQYEDTGLPEGPDRLGMLMGTLLRKRIKVQGFIIFADYAHRQAEFSAAMETWVDDGKIKFKEDVVHGLDNAPEAFIGMLQGKNFGKLMICVADC